MYTSVIMNTCRSPHDSTFVLPSYIEEGQTSTPISRSACRVAANIGRRPALFATNNPPTSLRLILLQSIDYLPVYYYYNSTSLSTTLAFRDGDPCTSTDEADSSSESDSTGTSDIEK